MSTIDNALAANLGYAKNYRPTRGSVQLPTIAVAICMDRRFSDGPAKWPNRFDSWADTALAVQTKY
jgi:hypothetical protein